MIKQGADHFKTKEEERRLLDSPPLWRAGGSNRHHKVRGIEMWFGER